ncbi:hypothetical protein ACE103_27670 [Bradyrhizobium sp. ma5]|uniref:hypothetical protein n=1 Tax=Bradyrhizobium sp. ma5 TaxID=3344828 RepID=UPI0035D51334
MKLGKLIEEYRADPDSDFRKLKYEVRVKHERLLSRIAREHGSSSLERIRTRNLISWYNEWLGDDDKVAMAHSLVGRLRVLFRFGAAILEDKECARLFDALSSARFEMIGPRYQTMTLDQANAIRLAAHGLGWPSIALAQALQFELLLNQRDVIGEWVPLTEEGVSDVRWREQKWLRGLRWSNIDSNNVLRHSVGKQQRQIQVDLQTAPMVIDELQYVIHRTTSGPLVINEITAMPWSAAEFRRKWRLVAKEAGVPDDITNRDSRPAGMIRGGGERARIVQGVTLRMLRESIRASRHRNELLSD